MQSAGVFGITTLFIHFVAPLNVNLGIKPLPVNPSLINKEIKVSPSKSAIGFEKVVLFTASLLENSRRKKVFGQH